MVGGNEVAAALRRLETVLPLAASLETRLQRHVMQQIVQVFGRYVDVAAAAPAQTVLAAWQARHRIPEPNDLSAEAKSILFHSANWGNEAAPLLLTTLPRALSAVGSPVHQWEQFDLLKCYAEALGQRLAEIAQYEPLSIPVDGWLSGFLSAIERPKTTLPRERRQLTALVAQELGEWLRERRLPPFVADLSLDDLRAILPASAETELTALMVLLQRDATNATHGLVSEALPGALGLPAEHEQWDAPSVTAAVTQLRAVCCHVGTLPAALRRELYRAIGQIFGAATAISSPAELLELMRTWRSSYVILPKDSVSANARLVYEALAGRENDPDALLLQRLPSRMAEVREAYGRWSNWSIRDHFLAALKQSAEEIAQYAVNVTNDQAETLWQDFRRRIATLSVDEQRWVVKAFREEFQP